MLNDLNAGWVARGDLCLFFMTDSINVMKRIIISATVLLLAGCTTPFWSGWRSEGTGWRLTPYNQGIVVNQIPPTGFGITIPPKPNYVNSIQHSYQLKAGQTITVQYRVSTVSGKPIFKATEGTNPANFSVMFARRLTDERWYAYGVDFVRLQDVLDKGPLTYSIPLTPERWQNVNGRQDAEAFNREIQDVRLVEIVFGGQFRAHGIEVEGGTAKFEVLAFSIR